MQAIVWLAKPMKTVFFDVSILVCDIDPDTLQVIMSDDQRLIVSYDNVLLACDVISGSADFLLKSEGEYIAGVVDCRASV